ncbi:hypothetical protein IQ07DRAFT_665224 [Pyrenochaeta sp. DS3sAY3a]|nr:hypothetical protein IQ07DRAFT_665224 [Pyrenochaeta sp. DS3sAY3a]
MTIKATLCPKASRISSLSMPQAETISLFKTSKNWRYIANPIGWGGAVFEWVATYLIFRPEDGRSMKEHIQGIYDGSMFYTIASNASKRHESDRDEH